MRAVSICPTPTHAHVWSQTRDGTNPPRLSCLDPPLSLAPLPARCPCPYRGSRGWPHRAARPRPRAPPLAGCVTARRLTAPVATRAPSPRRCPSRRRASPEWLTAVESAASGAATANTRGSGWAPSGPVSPLGAPSRPELPGAP
eukprot:scaffold42099_cov60-Phaeocystis_antarctica.AAC.1